MQNVANSFGDNWFNSDSDDAARTANTGERTYLAQVEQIVVLVLIATQVILASVMTHVVPQVVQSHLTSDTVPTAISHSVGTLYQQQSPRWALIIELRKRKGKEEYLYSAF